MRDAGLEAATAYSSAGGSLCYSVVFGGIWRIPTAISEPAAAIC
jgi:hypothetical protein